MKKEIIAVLSGVFIVYLWQIFLIMPNNYIPQPKILILISPMVIWVMMGIVKVKWMDKWIIITSCIGVLFTPFILIAVVTLITKPSLWVSDSFWIANAVISIMIGNIVLRPLFKK